MHRTVLALAALLAVAPLAAGAQGPARAPGWTVRFDRPGIPDSAVAMGAMAPGWHVTSKSWAVPAIAYDAALSGGRTFKLESEIIFFVGTGTAGAGVTISGRALETEAPRFVAFTVFPDGRFSITRYTGAQREQLVLPTVEAAIAKHPGGTVQVKNVLAIEGDERFVTFRVNAQQVARLPRAVVDPGGTVGLRLEPGVNAHITSFVLDGRNVAPMPTR
ncbi:MAG: hypothetical protein HY275_03180 [Gemmatimonadetes bacterium]|nr:hypothetical protein [Gemmatimonadota bacterium]